MSIIVHDGPGEPNPFEDMNKHGSHDQSSHGRGRGGGGGGKGKASRPAPRPRDMMDAADYLADKDPIASGRYEAIGLSNMSADTANEMVDRAKKLGWQPQQ